MRPVTADHVLFDEAIAVFRAPEPIYPRLANAAKDTHRAYVLLDFQIPIPLDCGEFQLQPTQRVNLAGAYAAFIAPLELPTTVDQFTAHHFAIAASTLICFATGRPVKTMRDEHFHEQWSADLAVTLAVHFPVLTAGPGAHQCYLSSEYLSQYCESIKTVISLLRGLADKDYVRFMRAMRLVQLAHNSERDDFALAYYLLVSAIEIIATHAISRNNVRERHPQEKEWREAGKTNPMIQNILKAYRAERGNNKYLKERFVEFVLQYCRPMQWSELEHPFTTMQSMLKELSPGASLDYLTRERPFEIYPHDLPEPFVRKVLGDLYKYRSNFTHEGAAPPHRNPVSYNHYFDDQLEYDEERREVYRLLLPNFRLVAFIAQQAILRYGIELLGRSQSVG